MRSSTDADHGNVELLVEISSPHYGRETERARRDPNRCPSELSTCDPARPIHAFALRSLSHVQAPNQSLAEWVFPSRADSHRMDRAKMLCKSLVGPDPRT